MTSLHRRALLALLVPVAVTCLGAPGLRDARDRADTGSTHLVAIATKCVGVDHAALEVSRCVPFPDTLG